MNVFPPLGISRYLRHSLCGMDGLKWFGPEFYGEEILRPFPSIEELSLRGFPNLEEWSPANDGDAFSKLRKLIVDNRPILINMARFPSLQHLELRNSLYLGKFSCWKHVSDISGDHLLPQTRFDSIRAGEPHSFKILDNSMVWRAYVSAAKFAEPRCFRVIGD